MLSPELDEPAPKLAKRFRDYQTFNPTEAKAIKLERNRLKRRRNTLIRVVAGLALVGAGLSTYVNDVRDNQELQASASISIQVEGQALDEANNDTALVFIDGYGTDDAGIITEYMGRAVQPVIDGQRWSVKYNNAGLEPSEIAERIIRLARQLGVEHIVFVGRSAGGNTAMLAQEEVIKHSALSVDAIVLISTPDGVKYLQPATQTQIQIVEAFAGVPGIRHSGFLRRLGEVGFRYASWTSSSNPIENAQNLIETINDVNAKLESNTLPGMSLMFDQMLAIQTSDIEQRMENISLLPEYEVHPTTIVIGTAAPGYDRVVESEGSSASIMGYATKFDVPALAYDVPGADHFYPQRANKAYIKTFADAAPEIQATIANQKSIASLHRITSQYIPPILKEIPKD